MSFLGIGGSSKRTTQEIVNNSITQELDNIQGAVITDVEGDVTILDAGAIAAANNLSQIAVQANTNVVTQALGANANVTQGAFGFVDGIVEALGDALSDATDFAEETVRASGQQVSSITREITAATRSDAADSINNITRFGAITVGVLGLAFIIMRSRK